MKYKMWVCGNFVSRGIFSEADLEEFYRGPSWHKSIRVCSRDYVRTSMSKSTYYISYALVPFNSVMEAKIWLSRNRVEFLHNYVSSYRSFDCPRYEEEDQVKVKNYWGELRKTLIWLNQKKEQYPEYFI